MPLDNKTYVPPPGISKITLLARAVMWILDNWDEGPAAAENAAILRDQLVDIFEQPSEGSGQ